MAVPKAQIAEHFLGMARPHRTTTNCRAGGNSVETAAPSAIRDFVEARGGHTVITSVLIANNGIAAVKEIRSIRKWWVHAHWDCSN